MSKEKRRVPRLRFPGFTGDWEQRKLGDIATFSKGNGYSKSDLVTSGDPIILYGRLYTNYETTISNVDTFVELKDKSVISQGGEVIVPASGETAEDISRASVVKNQGIIIGGDLNVIKANHLIEPTFLALTISNGEQQKELSKRAQGKSVVHLQNCDLQEVNLTFPLLNEQKEISTLFEKMDNIITLHQRKLNHLILKKKSLLQKLFPKNGDRYPELRFPEFTGDWEQRKLGEIGKWYKGIGGTKDDLNTKQSGRMFVHYADLYQTSEFLSNVVHWTINETIGSLIAPNSILFPMSDVTPYGLARTTSCKLKDVRAGGDVLINTIDTNIDSDFVSIYINLFSKNILPFVTGTTVKHINSKSLSELTILIPSFEEQVKIVNLVKFYNEIITLHQRKLDHLQLQKKALLQQMFV